MLDFPEISIPSINEPNNISSSKEATGTEVVGFFSISFFS